MATLNTDTIKGKWKEIQGKIKQQWGKFTDDEVTQMEGSYEELAGKIQQKYGCEKDQAEREIKDFINKNHLNS